MVLEVAIGFPTLDTGSQNQAAPLWLPCPDIVLMLISWQLRLSLHCWFTSSKTESMNKTIIQTVPFLKHEIFSAENFGWNIVYKINVLELFNILHNFCNQN